MKMLNVRRLGSEWLCRVFFFALLMAARTVSAQVLTVTDVSPDFPFGAKIDNLDGRIVGVVVDPTNDSVLYAASPWAGVWKSTDAARSWQQASNGLRNRHTQISAYPNLAIDAFSPRRLIYATSSKDGRPPFPCQSSATHQCYGGLWGSVDGAASWFHVNLCGPGGVADNIATVIFSAGRPFVATDCGIWSTQDSNLLDGSWTSLPALPNGISPGGTILAPSANASATLFACLGGGNRVYRSQDFGQSWDTGVALAGRCTGLSSVFLPQEFVPSTSVALHFDQAGTAFEATVVNHDAGSTQDLGFAAVGTHNCCGRSGLAVVPRKTNPGGTGQGPGATYDVFAWDNFSFFHYRGNNQWSNPPFSLHADTWWMAFPSSYDSGAGFCPAYAANDGGIFANASNSCGFDGWVGASSGLHVTYGIQISGLSITNLNDNEKLCVVAQVGQPCPLLFLPSADTDTFIRTAALAPTYFWSNFPDGLGDSGLVLIDPAQPNLAMAARNGNYNLFVEPSGGPPTATTPHQRTIAIGPFDPDPSEQSGVSTDFFVGISDPAPEALKQVLTMPGETPLVNGDFMAVRSDFSTNLNGCAKNSPPNCANDVIVRNISTKSGEEVAEASWFDISPAAQFGPGQVAGIYPSGGHGDTTVYVLTSNDDTVNYGNGAVQAGQVWKAQSRIIGEPITSWINASGGSGNALGRAYNVFVNPYDPSELYATDLGPSSGIKVSRDGGQSWTAIPQLKDIATNHGEFDFACGKFVNGPNYSILDPFGQECSLTSMVFPPGQPLLRFAVLYPGGLAFSRDSGTHWISLDVTNSASLPQLIEAPHTAFYDPSVNAAGNSSLYVALAGRGVVRVDAPFATLEAGAEVGPGGRLALAYQTSTSQLDAAVVDKNGALSVLWVVGAGSWQGPGGISVPGFAPSGAKVALAHQVSLNQLNAVTLDTTGALSLFSVTGNGKWTGPLQLTAPRFAPAGGNVALAHQASLNQLDAVVVDAEGAVSILSVTGAGQWQGPTRITSTGFAPPGGYVAVAQQNSINQLDAVLVGSDGAVYVLSVTGEGQWQGPTRLTSTGFAPPGGHIGLSQQNAFTQLDALLVGQDGALSVLWVTGTDQWQGPQRISATQLAPPGAHVALAEQASSGQLDVALVGTDGTLLLFWVVGVGQWQGPLHLTGPGFAAPGADAALEHQNSINQLDAVLADKAGAVSVLSVPGLGNWTAPVSLTAAGFAP